VARVDAFTESAAHRRGCEGTVPVGNASDPGRRDRATHSARGKKSSSAANVPFWTNFFGAIW